MNKFLTAGVTALTTLTACAGVVGVMSVAPGTKTMFDFKGKNQQEITRLNTELKHKDNLITEKDSTIDNLENENNSKQMTINELKTLLPQEVEMPEDMKGIGCAYVIDMDDCYIISDSASGVNGLWVCNKQTLEIKTIDISSIKYKSKFRLIFQMEDKLFLQSGQHRTNNYSSLSVLDLNTLTCKFIGDFNYYSYGSINIDYKISANRDKVVFSDIYHQDLYYYNTKTEETISYNKDINGSSSLFGVHFIDNDRIIYNFGKVLNLDTGESFTVEFNEYKYCYSYNNTLYLLSSSSGFYKCTFNADESYNLELLSSEILSYSSIYLDNNFVVMAGSGKVLVLYNNKSYLFNYSFTSSISKCFFNEKGLLVVSSYRDTLFLNLESLTFDSIGYGIYVVLPNDVYIMCYSSNYGKYIDVCYFNESKSKYVLLQNDFTTFTMFVEKDKYTDLGEGKYLLYGEDGYTNYVYDSTTKTITLYSLLI